ncbi:MAG: ImmA/IrrE family metallo-endopeptidase [Vicinamibacteria bacterium]|nr:ImmA/IrrE family metallo-endopeptidase [Vicinamibacteria bacterium]
MSNQVVGIEKAVLRWARESAGLTPEAVAAKLKRSVGEVHAWERGEALPSYAQLEKLAYTIYKRPLAAFFLPSPPIEQKARQEFRTLPAEDLEQLLPDTLFLVRSAHAFQLSLRELSEGANPAAKQILRDLQVPAAANAAQVAQRVRAYLGITVEKQAAFGSDDQALARWRSAVESAGVFVFKNSFKQKQISGFCLYDPEFPLIYLNNSTSKTRQTFSLLHELAHLLFHANGISKFEPDYFDRLPPNQRLIEVLCNRLASEILIPSDDFLKAIASVRAFEDTAIEALARRYSVSREAVARRLLDLGKMSKVAYEAKAARWTSQLRKKTGKGNANSTKAVYLGDAYLRLVFQKHYQGRISTEAAADYLGVRPSRLPALESILMSRKAVA